MEGFGVSNYSVDNPSFSFTTRTTEFDDALLNRNVISLEQAMVAKGASIPEAHRLAQLRRKQQQQQEAGSKPSKAAYDDNDNVDAAQDDDEKDHHSLDDSFDDDDDDDDFIAKYRQHRLQELKQQQQQQTKQKQIPNHKNKYGRVISITRSEWIREVNDDSLHTWVVVLLTKNNTSISNDSKDDSQNNIHHYHRSNSRGLRQLTSPLPSIELALSRLAIRFPHVKFVQIVAYHVNPHWPIHHIPAMLLYRHGQMNHQLMVPTISNNMSETQVEHELMKFGILLLLDNVEGQQQPKDDDDDDSD